jgi:hypothetical protein
MLVGSADAVRLSGSGFLLRDVICLSARRFVRPDTG